MSHATHPVAWTALAVLLVQIVLHLSLTLNPAHSRVVISEIMYRPGSGEPEWVELYNAADTAVALDGWILHDRTSARPALEGGTIPSRGFVVVTRDTAVLRSLRSIPSPLLALSLPSLNNSGDDLVLLDAAGRTVDSVSFSSSWGGTGGALERIDHRRSSLDERNWGESIDSTGATPGRKNSIAPVGRDLAVGGGSFAPDRSVLIVPIRNRGSDPSVGATLSLFHDGDRNGRGDVHETISGRGISPIPPDDSTIVELPWPRPLTAGGEEALLVLDHPEDEVPGNNVAVVTLRLPSVDTGLIINEIMYDPDGDEPEWIELHNRGTAPVNTDGWILHDAGKSRPVLPEGIILPGGDVVVSSDTTLLREARPDVPAPLLQAPLPSLNNGGDMVVLRRPDGTMVDSLVYTSSCGGREGSLERRGAWLPSTDPASWSSSLSEQGATPGAINSVLLPTRNITLLEARFDQQRGMISVTLRTIGADSSSGAELAAGVDTDGNGAIAADEIASTRQIPADTAQQILELDWTRPLLPGGEEVVLFVRWEPDEFRNDDTLRLEIRRRAPDSGIVINEIMFDPESGDPEWVELFNMTDNDIDLEAWRIGDGSGLSTPLPSVTIAPGGWLVVTTDTGRLVDRFGPITPLLNLPSLPALNNGGDIAKLLNRDGVAVDSLRYASSWGASGRSLERKGTEFPSTGSQNWTPSTDPLGGTPGRANSWRPVLIDLVLSTPIVLHEPDGITISGLVFNRGSRQPGGPDLPDSCSLMLGVDLNRDGVADPGEELDRREIPFPGDGDSTRFSVPWSRTPTIDGEWGLVVVDVEEEENRVDNVRTIVIRRERIDSGLVINEIMYDPLGDEPEWIEIANRSEDTVELEGWVLHDAGSARPLLPRARLAPGKFIVCTSDSATLRNTRAVFSAILQVPLPTLNNGGDLVILRAPEGRVVDSVRYDPDWGGEQGRSLERRGLLQPSGDSASWGSSIDGGGGTPGWENSILPAGLDLRLDGAEFDPDRAAIRIIVRNVGSKNAQGGEVILYVDVNGDGVPDPEEMEIVQNLPEIPPGDSVHVESMWQRELLPEGESGLAEVRLPGEERIDDNILPFHLRAPLGRTGPLINEFQSAPTGSEPEWVELYNHGSLPIDLDGWSIADRSSPAMIRSRSILHPGRFAVITLDTALLRAAHTLTGSPLLIEVQLPALNNGGDAIILRNAEGALVDSLTYGTDWPEGNGRSLERRHPALDPNDPVAWKGSGDPEGGTPGRTNSELLPEWNLAVDSTWFDVESGWLQIVLRNAGALTVPGGSIELLLDGSRLDRLPLGPLRFNESITLEYRPPVELTDQPQVLKLALDADLDSISTDDTAQVTLLRPPADTGLIITEIMFDPLPGPDGTGAEYVELYNHGIRPVGLAGWSIEEGSGSSVTIGISESDGPMILPGEFGLIASDSSLFVHFPELLDSGRVMILGEDFGLNNSGDIILLRNRSDRIVDSLRWSADWHDETRPDTRGISLERIDFDRPSNDPDAWASSVDRRGGTPATENSRRLPPAIGEEVLELSSATLSPDGDGFEDFLRIAWNLPFTPASVQVTILDPRGHSLATPVDGMQSGARGDAVWDGESRDGRTLPIGPVIVRLEAVESGTGHRVIVRRVVVIAGRL